MRRLRTASLALTFAALILPGASSRAALVTSTSATTTPSGTTFSIDFDTDILPASSFDADKSVVGFIDIDIDRDAATGSAPLVNTLGGGSITLGDEYYIDLGYEAFDPGFAKIWKVTNPADPFDNPDDFGAVAISYTARGLSLVTSLVGATADGRLDYAIVVGNFNGPTGVSGVMTSVLGVQAVPEPSTLFSGLVAALAGVGLWRRRRRAA